MSIPQPYFDTKDLRRLKKESYATLRRNLEFHALKQNSEVSLKGTADVLAATLKTFLRKRWVWHAMREVIRFRILAELRPYPFHVVFLRSQGDRPCRPQVGQDRLNETGPLSVSLLVLAKVHPRRHTHGNLSFIQGSHRGLQIRRRGGIPMRDSVDGGRYQDSLSRSSSFGSPTVLSYFRCHALALFMVRCRERHTTRSCVYWRHVALECCAAMRKHAPCSWCRGPSRE